MTLRLTNTLTRSLDPFEPLHDGQVRVYACGPTVYDHAHIGNFRAFVFYDLVHRYLEWRGFDVRFVMNLTDVDDKTIDGALEAAVGIREYTEPYAEAFLEDSRALGIRPVDAYPRATDYVEPMVGFVRRLLDKGLAYTAEDGSVYFSIAKFPDYGKLSGVDLEQVRPGARVAQDEYTKEDARDFVLWKAARDKDRRVGAVWDAPWGEGRPGWHLECSVMGVTELGETLDLHLGGEDLVFPHHEDEIAQSEGATGTRPFVRVWLHVKHLLVEGRKMSKSAGNFIRVRELVDDGHEPAAIRHQLLSAQYRRELNFTRDGLEGSARAVQRLLDFHDRLEALPVEEGADGAGVPARAEAALERFQHAMDDDLNSADAMAALFVLVSEVNGALDGAGAVSPAARDAALAAVRSMDEVLGLVETARSGRSVDSDTEAWIEAKIRERAEARKARDFARADAIRDDLAERGIVLEDSAAGTRWKLVRSVEAGAG